MHIARRKKDTVDSYILRSPINFYCHCDHPSSPLEGQHSLKKMGKKQETTIVEREVVSWHALSIEECILKLRARENLLQTGLTTAEAQQRLAEFGPNKMTEGHKETIWEKIWKQIANVLVCILLFIATVSAIRGILEMAMEEPEPDVVLTSWVQVGLILGVIIINTIIGIKQEGDAEKSAEALKNMLSADARVLRDGEEKLIPADQVVPGDIIILSLGDRCPADIRVTQSANLANQEAALTGEAVPIDKETDTIAVPSGSNAEQIALGDRRNMGFSATLVAQGSGVGIAVTTGDYTQIGTINKLVSQVEKKQTNVIIQLNNFSRMLAIAICVMTIATICAAKFLAKQGWFDAVSTGLVCCVAMVPEGLEAMVTLVYSWATMNMAKKNAIVRALPAVETLGSVTVICSDKTGTLTQNLMSLTAFVTSNSHYKFDVNASNRSPTNFVREDAYLAKRAENKHGKASDMSQPRKGQLENSNHYSIDTSLHPTDDDTEEPKSSAPSTAPFAEGASPDIGFVKNALACGVLCSKCKLGKNGTREGELGNPTEISILRAAYFSGLDIETMKTDASFVTEVPFSSEYKFMATIHDTNDPDNYTVYVKGAPDRMVKLCTHQAKGGVLGDLEPCDTNYWIEKIAILSSHGLRVLALCQGSVPRSSVSQGENLGQDFVNGREEGKWLTIVGLCAIMDPPRPECVQAIAEAKKAGVRVAMITGDHKDTATAIGSMLGIVDEKYGEAVTGPELDAMSDEEMKEVVMNHNVFARASPQNKIRIVKALQSQRQIASMTGDGVNDAPALKAADMGVAMGKEGTDVAREASEMILADDNFATIVAAVKEGRVVWDNLRKVLMINTPINNAQGMSVLFGILFGLAESPLSSIQVLYSNLICAITLGFVSAIEPAEDGIMDFPPRRIGKRLMGRFLFARIMLSTVSLTLLVIFSAFWLISFNEDGKLYRFSDHQKALDFCTKFVDDSQVVSELFDEVKCNQSEKKYFEMVEPLVYYQEHIRAIAFNVLDFGAVGVTLSARFTYLSSIHPRVFFGNKYAWYSVLTVTIGQLFCTYVPGVNTIVFSMLPLDAFPWLIIVLFMFIQFFIMEAEKAFRSYMKHRGSDTDDQEYFIFDNQNEGADAAKGDLLPKGASKLNLVALEK